LINFFEIKRAVSYFAIAIISIMSIFVMLITGFQPYIAVFFGFFISLLVALLCFINSSNTFTRIVSGAEYGVLVIGSSGSLKFYTATVQGGKFVSYIDGKPIEQKFNRNLFWYVSKNIVNGILRKKEGEKVNSIVFEAPLPAGTDNLSSEIFKTDYPFLVYVPGLQSFITKEWFFKMEYDSMFFNFGWELKQSIDEHNKAAGGITRHILDLIAAKGKSPQAKKFMMIFIGLVIGILALVTFGPMVYDFLNTLSLDPASAEKLISNKLN